jgi:hypothetical protein
MPFIPEAECYLGCVVLIPYDDEIEYFEDAAFSGVCKIDGVLNI